MKLLKKVILIIISLFVLVGCDAATKNMANKELKGKVNQSYFGGTLQLVYAENTGGMLGIGSKLNENTRFAIFTIVVSLALTILFFYTTLKKNLSKWHFIAFVLILSGGLGNLLNRITNEGKVVDFMVFELLDIHTGIFNIADVYITTGVILLFILNFIIKDQSLQIKI